MTGDQEHDLAARLDRLEAALAETQQSLEESRGHVQALAEAMRDTANGGIQLLRRLERCEDRLGMEP